MNKKRVTCPIRTGTRKPEEGLVKEWRKGTRENRECAEGKSQERGKECEKWKMPRETSVGQGGRNNYCRSIPLISRLPNQDNLNFGPTGLDQDSIGSQAFIERPAWGGGAIEFSTRW